MSGWVGGCEWSKSDIWYPSRSETDDWDWWKAAIIRSRIVERSYGGEYHGDWAPNFRIELDDRASAPYNLLRDSGG